jgi:hypothetical protein
MLIIMQFTSDGLNVSYEVCRREYKYCESFTQPDHHLDPLLRYCIVMKNIFNLWNCEIRVDKRLSVLKNPLHPLCSNLKVKKTTAACKHIKSNIL